MKPTKFEIAKAYCAPDGELDNNSPSSILKNPESLNEFAGLVQSMNKYFRHDNLEE